jgi:hypothetical protein
LQNSESNSKNLEVAAGALGLQIQLLNARSDRDVEAVFATLAQCQVAAAGE